MREGQYEQLGVRAWETHWDASAYTALNVQIGSSVLQYDCRTSSYKFLCSVCQDDYSYYLPASSSCNRCGADWNNEQTVFLFAAKLDRHFELLGLDVLTAGLLASLVRDHAAAIRDRYLSRWA